MGGGGGVFCNFGFGLRKKSWILGWGGNLSDLDLGWKFGFLGGGYSATSDLDLGKKVLEICNFGFGLWKFGFWGGVFCNFGFGLRKKVGNLDFWEGGYSANFGFGLRKKSWKFGFLGWGGVFCNFGFGLRKVGNLIFGMGGGFWKGDGKKKKPTLQKN